MISILALKLPLVGAYFPRRHHHHFKIPTNARFDRWHSPSKPRRGDHTYVISGSVAFIETMCSHENVDNTKVIACFEQNIEQDGMVGRAQWNVAWKLCSTFSLSPVTMRDMQFGGATNARFLFGFGGSFDSSHLPTAHPDIQRSLRHFLDGGIEGCFPSVLLSEVPIIAHPPWVPIKHVGVLQQEGLFNVQRPRSKVLCAAQLTPIR